MPYGLHEKLDAEEAHKSGAVSGAPFSVGQGFNAHSFKHDMYSGAMDPLIMVDHFVMTEPTFGPHAHAGLSAVSILFEDSVGQFHNKDSLGNDIDLKPGDLYWLKAGRGAVHDEKPRPGARTHALQLFVNLPARMKYDAPDTLHVKASDMPILTGPGYRGRLMLGERDEHRSKSSPALPMTILDVTLNEDARFEHGVPAGNAVFILSIDGEVTIHIGQETVTSDRGKSISFRPRVTDACLVLNAAEQAHVTVLQAAPLNEAFVQQGPFAMSTQAEVDAMFAAHAAGKLGSIDS